MCFKKIRSFVKKKAKKIEPVSNGNSESYPDITIDHKSSNTTTMVDENASHATNRKTSTPEFKFLEQLILHRLNKYFPSQEKEKTNPIFYEINEWILPIKEFILNNNLDQ